MKGLGGEDKREEKAGSDVTHKTVTGGSISHNKNSHNPTKYKIENNIINYEMTFALRKQEFSGDMKELDNKIETMIGRGNIMIKVSEKRAPTKAIFFIFFLSTVAYTH